MAPCSHVWHYRCIRPILNDSRTWPQFLCPNCRAVADLEADVEDPLEFDEEIEEEEVDVSPVSNGIEFTRPSTGEDFPNGTPERAEAAQSADSSAVRQDAVASGSQELEVLTNRTNRPSPGKSDQLATNNSTSGSLLSRRNVSNNSLLQRGIRAARPGGSDQNSCSPKAPRSPTNPQQRDATQLVGPSSSLLATTPTAAEVLGPDGPMTPMNDAGPFVFDGSAGRAEGRRAVVSLTGAAPDSPGTSG